MDAIVSAGYARDDTQPRTFYRCSNICVREQNDTYNVKGDLNNYVFDDDDDEPFSMTSSFLNNKQQTTSSLKVNNVVGTIHHVNIIDARENCSAVSNQGDVVIVTTTVAASATTLSHDKYDVVTEQQQQQQQQQQQHVYDDSNHNHIMEEKKDESDMTTLQRQRQTTTIPTVKKNEWLSKAPSIQQTHPTTRDKVVKRKLRECSDLICDFGTDDRRNYYKITIKRNTLLDLLVYFNTCEGQQRLSKQLSLRTAMATTIKVHLSQYEPLSSFHHGDISEPDDVVWQSPWTHLEPIYRLLLLLLTTGDASSSPPTSPKMEDDASSPQTIDDEICRLLVKRFSSNDKRERHYLKLIVHRIYKVFKSHRPLVKSLINDEFLEFVYEEKGHHHGVKDLLLIYECIIAGFSSPLEDKHYRFLQKVLLPLHKPSGFLDYQKPLFNCIKALAIKDPHVLPMMLKYLIKTWPWKEDTSKQLLLIEELELLWEMLDCDQFRSLSRRIFALLARLMSGDHYQIVERTMFVWNNDLLRDKGFIREEYAHVFLPYVYKWLRQHSEYHFNPEIASMARCLLDYYKEMTPDVVKMCEMRENDEVDKMRHLRTQWKQLEDNIRL